MTHPNEITDEPMILDALLGLLYAGKLEDRLEGVARSVIESRRTLSEKQLDWARDVVYRVCSTCICPVHGVPIDPDELSLFLDVGHCGRCENRRDD